jgi:hypothetical protein
VRRRVYVIAAFIIGLMLGGCITQFKTDLPLYMHTHTDDFATIATCLSTGP